LKHLQKLILCGARCDGGSIDFTKNRNCYKIHAADPDDDIVDMWAAHHMDVARSYSRIDYNNDKWNQFYKSLQLIFEIENNLKDLDVIKIDIDKIKEEMFKSMDIIEEDLN
jgi:hypothetical protein